MHVVRGSISALATALLATNGHAQATESEGEPVGFSIRADPSVADRVNEVLTRYARSVVTDVPAGRDAAGFLNARCGGKSDPQILSSKALPNGRSRIEHTPCLRIVGTRTVLVEPGLTLEGIAARSGLRPDKVNELKIEPGPSNPERAVITPRTMLPGDRVVVPQTSLWTEIQLKPEVQVGRQGLVSALSDALNCKGDQEGCVRSRGVLLLSHGQPIEPTGKATGDVPEDLIPPGKGFDPSLIKDLYAKSLIGKAPKLAFVQTAATLSVAPAAAVAVAKPIPERVSREQWPYDPKLVAATLRADRDWLRDVKIGVADGGLRTPAGEPLTPDVLAVNDGEFMGGSADDDDDENFYIDDLYGAGLRRQEDTDLATDMLGTGRLDLCPGNPDFSAWSQAPQRLASHGAIVSSIAAGWPLRSADVTLLKKLPRITFYRMVTRQCAPDSAFDVQGGEINKAIRYLFGQNAEVVNLSYRISLKGDNSDLRAAAKAELNNDTRLLVVAAGNDDPDNLDEGRLCPACLGAPNAGDLARRVLVIGAAEPTLRMSPGSNSGEKTVQFYAPGQPRGINILGQSVDDPSAATSYAAPLAALAVAMLKAYGITSYWDIRERLDAASWSLRMPDGSFHSTARVIDLTKVASVYHDLIEATVKEDGILVRRNFIGSIEDNLQDLQICLGRSFKRATVHSIRLGPTAPDGSRRAQWEQRWQKEAYEQYSASDCRSSGQIRMKGLQGQTIEFPLDEVNHILLRWRAPPS